MNRIVSSLPGRIRIRDKDLRDQVKLNALKNELLKMPAITALQDNVRIGSVLVRFDASAIEVTAMEANINSAVDQVIGKPSTSLFAKKHINRYNKMVMLASFGSSIAFAVARPRRWRRWHALTSYIFIANLGVHLFIYRKSVGRLFRS